MFTKRTPNIEHTDDICAVMLAPDGPHMISCLTMDTDTREPLSLHILRPGTLGGIISEWHGMIVPACGHVDCGIVQVANLN